jgi:multicomponent Na+:H+ antiporter subunit E
MGQTGANPSAAAQSSPFRRWVFPVFLILFWVVLSGKFDFFHLSVGLLTVVYVVWQESRLPRLDPAIPVRIAFWRCIPYGFWLIWQMILSALQVARIILSPQDKLAPRLVAFRRPMPTTVQAVTFANSITLTPGTITVELEGDRYLVHALSEQTAQGLIEGDMDRRVAALSSGTDEGRIEVIPTSSFDSKS